MDSSNNQQFSQINDLMIEQQNVQAEIQDPSSNVQIQQMQYFPPQQIQQLPQMQQQQQMISQSIQQTQQQYLPMKKVQNKNQKSYNKPIQQQQQQQQNTSGGLFSGISNFFSNMFQKHDDDKIIVEKQIENNYNLDNNFNITIRSQYKSAQIKKDNAGTLPACISFQTQDMKINENAKDYQSIGIDLICVIDVSGSMRGQKIGNVQQALLSLLTFLGEKDRLCLITFSDTASRITPLKIVNEQNIKYFKDVIHRLRAGGGTRIGKGTELAFNEFKKRQYTNRVSSIFLLSDGQDGSAVNELTLQNENCQCVYSLYSFGFGNDHDANLMSELCQIGKGSFYYVSVVSLLDEFFADALGGLVSAVGEKLEIILKCQPEQPFQDIKIGKTYGDMWMVQEPGRQYKINIPQVASGQKKDYVFEITLPKFEGRINDNQRQAVIVQVQAKLVSTSDQQVILKTAQLELTFLNEDEPLPITEEDIDVSVQYMRVKATDVIDDARRACENNQFELAEEMLQGVQKEMDQNIKLKEAAQAIYTDVVQASKGCKQTNFHSHGHKQMKQMKINNYNQQGLNAQFNDLGVQMQQEVVAPSFQNATQKVFLEKVQKSKKMF